jgi:hypothetical protein
VSWKAWAAVIIPAAWTFAPMYAVEAVANSYYLSDNSAAFFTVSGWRLILFIIFAVSSSVAAGALLRGVWKSTVSAVTGLVVFLVSAYILCDPRVCFSSGPDGLEPLRLGFFLGSVIVCGGGLGASLRRARLSQASHALIDFFGPAAVCFYPVVFTLAGAQLLVPSGPWAAALLVALACLSMSATTALDLGALWGFALPVASLVVLIVLSAGIAAAYFPSTVPAVLALLGAGAVAAGAATLFVRAKRDSAIAHRSLISVGFALCLVFVLATMILSVPDEVVGVVPATGNPQGFGIGTPVYAGAFMDGPPGHAVGAAVTVSFKGTNASSIQENNFLSAGMGIHAAGCCVDGIDYSYRFDVYLFHSGNETLVASAWEACDDNAACGGHSWKILMFIHAGEMNRSEINEPVLLAMKWEQFAQGYGVKWTYAIADRPLGSFTQFIAPAAENHDFNTGVLPGGTLGPQQSASYFTQVGMMSRYSIGHGGWRVSLACPSVLTTSWSCAGHEKTLDGNQSFWKVFWRWGEEYTDVSAAAVGNDTVSFAYSGAGTTQNFVQLW